MKKLGISLRRVVTGSVLGMISLTITMLVSILMMPYIVHAVGDRMYGMWIFLASFVSYYSLLDLGLSMAVTRFSSKAFGNNDLNEVNKLLTTSSAFFLVLGVIVVSGITVTVLLVPSYLTDPQEALAARWILLTVAVTSLFQFGLRGFFGILYAKVRHDIIHTINIIKIIIRTGLIILFIESGYSVVSVAVAVMIAELIGYALDIYYVFRVVPEIKIKRCYFTPHLFRPLLKYSIFSMITQVSELVRMLMIPMIVTTTIGLNMVVFYTIATRLLEIFQQAISTLLSTLMPVFSSFDGANDGDKIKRVFAISMRVNIMLGIIFISGIIIFATPFIVIWMGSKYTPAAQIVMIIGVGYAICLSQEAGKTLAFGLSKHQRLSSLTLVESSAAAIGGFIGGTMYGFLGIAIGITVPVIAMSALLRPYVICRVINYSLVDYYKIVGELLLKLGVPIVAYYSMIHSYITSSFISIGVCAGGLILYLIPFVYWGLNADGRNILKLRIIFKLPLIKGVVNANA